MTSSNNNHRPLSRRIRKLLRTIENTRRTTFEGLQAGPFHGSHRDAIKSIIRQARKKGLIVSEDIPGNRVFYRLSRAGCRAIGAPREYARKLGEQGRYERFALVWLCFCDGPPRTIIYPAQDGFDVAPQWLRRVHFYLEPMPAGHVVGQVKIDFGTTPARLADNSCTRLYRYLESGWLDELIRARLFHFTVLTLSDSKRDDIEKALLPVLREGLAEPLAKILGQTPADFPIPVHINVVPGLQDLLPG